MKPGVAIVLATVWAFPALGWSQAPASRPTSGATAPAPARSVGGKTPDGKKQDDRNQPVTVDSDRMERFGKESLIIFTGNVVARHNNSVQYADRMEVYLDEKGDKILRSVSTGNVRIATKDCKTGTANRAEYFDFEQRMVLIGNARVWQDDNVVSGDTITIDLAQDRNVVTGGQQERVKAVFYSKNDNTKPAAGGAGQPACAN